MLQIIPLMHTLFPELVEPATRRCGIFIRFVNIGLPAMSSPNTNESGFLKALNSVSRNIFLKGTIARSLLGTSIPTADLPGMGASILIVLESVASESAMSVSSVTIRDTFVPGSSSISNLVKAAPFTTLTMRAGT